MSTTADITFRIDGEETDNILCDGESQFFSMCNTPNPDAAYGKIQRTRLYGISSGSVRETSEPSYTISTSLDEYGNPSDILLADSAGNYNFGLGGLSAIKIMEMF